MTDTAERIVKLAERFDPMPFTAAERNPHCDPAWSAWGQRGETRRRLLAIATPGAELGAAFDLCQLTFPDKAELMLIAATEQALAIPMDVAAALLAAMEDL